MGRFLPPDFDAGDPNTVGGYAAVHERPAAFEGKDGMSYSVEVVVDETGDPTAPYAGYLLFVRWRPGDPVATGHLETEYLVRAATAAEALARVGATALGEARRVLDLLIDEGAAPGRPWYDAMRDA